MSSLMQNLRNPFDPFERRNVGQAEEAFDVNQYFSVLNRLHLREHYVLDYVYRCDTMGGEPHLYARPKDRQPYGDYQEYIRQGESDFKYLEAIEVDDTPEGYVQFAILHVMGGQFYLWWHAAYNDLKIISDSASLEEILSARSPFHRTLPTDLQEKARKLQVEPSVELTRRKARVQLVVFTKWGGFLRRTYTISREFPHRILQEKSEVLVPYNCGIRF